MTTLFKQRDKRDLIRRFEQKAGHRQRAVASALSNIRPLEKRALDRCYNRAECDGRQAECRVCDYASVDLIGRFRRAAKGLASSGPWSMLTVVDTSWHHPSGMLSEVAPRRLLETVAQRLRRVAVRPAILALDLTLNRVQSLEGEARFIWVPHVNVLVPSALAATAEGEVRRFVTNATLGAPVHRPTQVARVQDLWVAINYALKLDLGRTRLRTQTERRPGHPRLGGKTLALPLAEFVEFLEWRVSFPPEHLIKLLGLRWCGQNLGPSPQARSKSVIERDLRAPLASS
jgi:hypothetical protein